MKDNNILALNIDSNSFQLMKDDFNKVLRKTLGNMQSKNSDEATLTLKLNISLSAIEVPDYESDEPYATRTALKPQFDHKVSSVMQIKTVESGRLKGEYELVWDDDILDFVMKPIVDGQRTFYDEQYNDYDEGEGDETVKLLPEHDVDAEITEEADE